MSMMNITFAVLFFVFIIIIVHFDCLRNLVLKRTDDSSNRKGSSSENKGSQKEENKDFPCSREELFQILLDNIPVSILVKDVENDFKHILWNKELERQTGLSEEEVLEKTDEEIEPWIGLNDFIARLDQEAIRKGSVQQECPCRTASGREIYYKTDKRWVCFPNGRSIILDMCLDLTTEWDLKKRLSTIVEKQDRLIAKTELLFDCIEFLSKTTNRETVYRYILRRFGEGESALRSYIYVFDSPAPNRLEHAYEWDSKSAKPIPGFLKKIDLIHLQNSKKQLLECKTASILSTEHLFPESIFQEWVEEEEIGTVIYVPLFYNEILYGMLGVDFRERQKIFPEISLPVLSSAARLIELVHSHEQMHLREGNR
ncbi:MAG: PAS domain-containing protein [Planctomycetia bacterium]|nr:PAS domain-containing protein [Planctomycetia bacterium]